MPRPKRKLRPLSNPNKYITTKRQHERRKQGWQKRKKSAVDPDWWESTIANDPYMYHATPDDDAAWSIANEGLYPWDAEENPRGSSWNDELRPRPGHTYLADQQQIENIARGQNKPHILSVDLRKLDPNRLAADEDAFMGGYDNDPPPYETMHGAGRLVPRDRYDEIGQVYTDAYKHWGHWPDAKRATQQWMDAEGIPHFHSWGDYANHFGLNQPHHIKQSFRNGTLAYNGVIPPEAIGEPKPLGAPCPWCGEPDEEIEDGQGYCNHCGWDSARACPECGEKDGRLEPVCPNCGYSELSAGDAGWLNNQPAMLTSMSPPMVSYNGEEPVEIERNLLNQWTPIRDSDKNAYPWMWPGEDYPLTKYKTSPSVSPDQPKLFENKERYLYDPNKAWDKSHNTWKEIAAKVARPVDPGWWDDYNNPDSDLVKALPHPDRPVGTPLQSYWYHGTSLDRAKQIVREGIKPWDEVVYSNYGDGYHNNWLEPRPGHVYLAQNPTRARQHADEIVGDHGERALGAVLKIDPTRLDPNLINPDEDTHPAYDYGIAHPAPDQSLGQHAEDEGWGDDPDISHTMIPRSGTLAYRGMIPPEAISLHLVQQPNQHGIPGPYGPAQVYAHQASGIADIGAPNDPLMTKPPETMPQWETLTDDTKRVERCIHGDKDCKICKPKRYDRIVEARLGSAVAHDVRANGNAKQEQRDIDLSFGHGQHYSTDDYEIRPADEGWFQHDTGEFMPRYTARGNDTLTTKHGQGDGRVAYYNGEPVASVTWQQTPNGYMIGSAYTKPEHRGKGLFNRLSEPLRSSGQPVDAVVWDNPMLRQKVRGWLARSEHPARVVNSSLHREVDARRGPAKNPANDRRESREERRKRTTRDPRQENQQKPQKPDGHSSRIAAMTRNQLLQLAQQHEQEYGPDQAQVVHQFPDSWTMRQLKTYGDMMREGVLMSNCFSPYTGMETGEQHPAWSRHPLETEEDWLQYDDPDVLATQLPQRLYSLRDPDNLPHVSIDPDGSDPALGRHNSPAKDEYLARIEAWQDAVHGRGNWENGAGDVSDRSWGRMSASRTSCQTNPDTQTQALSYSREGEKLPTDATVALDSVKRYDKIVEARLAEPQDQRGAYVSYEPISPDRLKLMNQRTAAAQVMYHVALKSAVPSIQQHGLTNTLAYESPWSNIDDYDDGTYLWDKLATAQRYAAEDLAPMGYETVIYEVNVAGLPIEPDSGSGIENMAEKGAWFCPEPITPDRLSLVNERTAMAYDPARDADHEMHDDLYSGWSSAHDYDPRWDYGDELQPHLQSHPLVQQAQRHLDQTGEHGRVYAADLSGRNAVGTYIFGTQGEPVVLIDPSAHEQLTETPEEASYQVGRTMDHELRHVQQERDAGGEPSWDEDDAEHGRTAAVDDDPWANLPKTMDELPDRGPYGGSEEAAGSHYYHGGGCGHLALAFKNLYPDMKLAAQWYDDHGRRALDHVAAYNPKTGKTYDVMGTNNISYHPYGSGVNRDNDAHPQDIADQMRIRWSPDEPWLDDNVHEASQWIAQHFGVQPRPFESRTAADIGDVMRWKDQNPPERGKGMFNDIPCPSCGKVGMLYSAPHDLKMSCRACGKSFPVKTDDTETWAEGDAREWPEEYWHDTEFDHRVAPQDFGPPRFGKTAAYEEHDEMLANGSVHARYELTDTSVIITEWSSLAQGQGNTKLAIAELRQKYPGRSVVAFDADTLNARPYWEKMREHGVDDITDEWGTSQYESKTAGQILYPRVPQPPLPEGVQEPEQCTLNASELDGHNGWRYMEGLAHIGDQDWTPHAWVVDQDGYVIDPTWTDTRHGFEYKETDDPFERRYWDEMDHQSKTASSMHYHVAPVAARESILTHGLDPSHAPVKWWGEADRSGDPDHPEHEGFAPGVWLYSDLNDARDWQRQMNRDEPQDIYEVRPPSMLTPDPFASTENGYYSSQPIPAQHVKRLDWIDPELGERTAAGPMMYHNSPVRNRQSIQQQGLRVDMDAGEGYTEPGIYMSGKPIYSPPGPYHEDTWQVDVGGLDPLPDPLTQEWEKDGGSFYVQQDIGPERLRLLEQAKRLPPVDSSCSFSGRAKVDGPAPNPNTHARPSIPSPSHQTIHHYDGRGWILSNHIPSLCPKCSGPMTGKGKCTRCTPHAKDSKDSGWMDRDNRRSLIVDGTVLKNMDTLDHLANWESEREVGTSPWQELGVPIVAAAGTPLGPHILMWEPGDYGRGLVTPTGEVHTWPEEWAEHQTWARDQGLEDDPEMHFLIRPDGVVSPHSANLEQANRIENVAVAADPKLVRYEDWKQREGSLGSHLSMNEDSPYREVEPIEHPDVGVRADHSPPGTPFEVSETLRDHMYGRDTGHFGTGVYFLSSPEVAAQMRRPYVRGVDLSGRNLYRPNSNKGAYALHDDLATLNSLANVGAYEREWKGYGSQPIRASIDSLYLPGWYTDAGKQAMKDAIDSTYADIQANPMPYGDQAGFDTASTRYMKAMGYDGIDVRHLRDDADSLSGLDNSAYGSVLYR